MELVRSDQYQGFLANPDPLGPNRTSYVYETAAARHLAPPAASSSGGGTSTLVVLLAVAGALVAAGAGIVAWAHS